MKDPVRTNIRVYSGLHARLLNSNTLHKSRISTRYVCKPPTRRRIPFGILICRRFHKLLKQVAAVSDAWRWILFQYLIVFNGVAERVISTRYNPYILYVYIYATALCLYVLCMHVCKTLNFAQLKFSHC